MDNPTIEKYNRRINKWNDILNNGNNVLFVRNMMDSHIYDGLHKEYIDSHVGYSESDINYIEDFEVLIAQKYKVDFDILVLNYSKKLFTPSKRIYNVVHEDGKDNSLYDEIFCQKICKKIKIKI
jgi:hypothetical protein